MKELFELPKDWDLEKVSYEYQVVLGKMIQSKPSNGVDISCLYHKAATIQNGYLLAPEEGMYSSPEEIKELEVRPGDLLVCEGGDIGRAAIVPFGIPPRVIFQNSAHRVRSKGQLPVQWLLFVLEFFRSSGLLQIEIGGSSTIKHFTNETFKNLRIPVPPYDWVNKSNAWLLKKLHSIDILISFQNKKLEKLSEYRQAFITKAVTQGLDPNVEMKESRVDWIGKVPAHWQLPKIKFVLSISHGKDPETKGEVPVYGSGGKPFKTCGEFKLGPTVLLGRKGATLHIPHYIEGKYWNVDTAFDTKAKGTALKLRYFYFIAQCLDYKLYISQTTLPGMTQSDYEAMVIPLPPEKEQQDILAFLEKKTLTISDVIREISSNIEKLKEYRSSLITAAVTGKLNLSQEH